MSEVIAVNPTPGPDQGWALLRQVLMILGGALTANGTVSQSTWQTITGVVMAVAPLVVAQLKVRLNAIRMAELAKDPAVKQVVLK